MCTLAILSDKRSSLIAMNRDEAYERPSTKNIVIKRAFQKEFLKASMSQKDFHKPYVFTYPEDELKKGTWIGVTTHKMVICVLNNYKKAYNTQKADFFSRGELPLLLSEEASLSDSEERLKSLDLSHYKPFYLVLFHYKEGFRQFVFDGKDFVVIKKSFKSFFLTTSRYSQDIHSFRYKMFESVLKAPKNNQKLELRRAFFQKFQEDKTKGISMEGSHSGTKSYTEILIEDSSVMFSYYNFPPSHYSEREFFKRASFVHLL